MDANECRTLIAAARHSAGCSMDETLQRLDAAMHEFRKGTKDRFKQKGEW